MVDQVRRQLKQSLYSKRAARPLRTECIDSCGSPTSTARMPVFAEMIGPMVEPHGQSFRTTNSCGGGSAARRASSRTRKEVIGVEAYRWFELDLITSPVLSFGPCAYGSREKSDACVLSCALCACEEDQGR